MLSNFLKVYLVQSEKKTITLYIINHVKLVIKMNLTTKTLYFLIFRKNCDCVDYVSRYRERTTKSNTRITSLFYFNFSLKILQESQNINK